MPPCIQLYKRLIVELFSITSCLVYHSSFDLQEWIGYRVHTLHTAECISFQLTFIHNVLDAQLMFDSDMYFNSAAILLPVSISGGISSRKQITFTFSIYKHEEIQELMLHVIYVFFDSKYYMNNFFHHTVLQAEKAQIIELSRFAYILQSSCLWLVSTPYNSKQLSKWINIKNELLFSYNPVHVRFFYTFMDKCLVSYDFVTPILVDMYTIHHFVVCSS